MFCSIIVLNYQGEKIIKKTLDSLTALNYPKDSYEIIVVDNGSKDNSKKVITDWIASHQSSVSSFRSPIVIYLPKNYGFAGGNNRGIQKATGKYVLLLNNDCTVEKNLLTELVAIAEKDEKIFAVNAKIMLGNTNRIQNAGICIFKNGYARDIGAIPKNNRQEYEEDRGQYELEREIDAACAAAVLYRASILREIGFFDESFFLYYEDVELSERAKFHGYKIMYAPRAIAHHIHAASSEEGSPFFIFHSEKGRLLHMLYHGPFTNFLLEYGKFACKAILRFGYGLRRPNRFAQQSQYIKVFLSLLYGFPIYFKKRIQLKKPFQFNIAYEISPLLSKTGSCGEKSGLYRLLFSTIQNMGRYLAASKLPSVIYLFSYYPSLLESLPPDLKRLFDASNVKLVTIAPYTFSFPLTIFQTPIRFLFRHTGNAYSQENYKKRLVKSLRRKNVRLIHHSETCFFEAPGFINMITINDLVPVKFPKWCQEKTITNMKKKLEFAKKQCQGVICISKNTQKDLLDYWGNNSNKRIEVIYPSISPQTSYSQSPISNLRSLISPPLSLITNLQSPISGLSSLVSHQYFLVYGTYEPRKNLMLLVQLFNQLNDEKKLNGHKLVLVGGKGWGNVYEDIKSFIRKKFKKISDSPIVQLGYQPDEVLLSFIVNAKAILYPTLYEGYGYPIAESLQLGVPVVTSGNSSLQEACSGRCIITQNNMDGWRKSILTIIDNGIASQKRTHFDERIIAEKTYSFYKSFSSPISSL